MERIALITGANKGIGYQTARILGNRGTTVLVGARDEQRGTQAESDLREQGIDAHAMRLDVTDGASIEQAAKDIEATYGRLDVLVNNAGIAGAGVPPGEKTLDALRRMLETNVLGVVAVTEAMLPLLRKASAARIVCVSSEVGTIRSMLDPSSPLWQLPAAPTYPVSKSALNMVTATYAKQLWDTPIKVNAANPGYCATDLNEHTGFRSAEQGAEVVGHLATLPEDGPTGVLWGHLWTAAGGESYGPLPW